MKTIATADMQMWATFLQKVVNLQLSNSFIKWPNCNYGHKKRLSVPTTAYISQPHNNETVPSITNIKKAAQIVQDLDSLKHLLKGIS
jgi:hypothetical protein